MEKALFEGVLCECWNAVANQRYHYTNAVLTGEDAAQEAAELMLRQFNEGKFEGFSEPELKARFFELARRRNQKLFYRQLTRQRTEEFVTAGAEGFEVAELSVENRELIEAAYGDDVWVAEALLEGHSLHDIARSKGMTYSAVRNVNNRAKRRAEELNV